MDKLIQQSGKATGKWGDVNVSFKKGLFINRYFIGTVVLYSVMTYTHLMDSPPISLALLILYSLVICLIVKTWMNGDGIVGYYHTSILSLLFLNLKNNYGYNIRMNQTIETEHLLKKFIHKNKISCVVDLNKECEIEIHIFNKNDFEKFMKGISYESD